MQTRIYGLRKAERLNQKQKISHLFDPRIYNGLVKAYPFMASWKFSSLNVPYPAQVLFVVSKKFSRKASKRASVKRQMREIYRYQKPGFYEFLEKRNLQVILALIYSGKEQTDFHFMKGKFRTLQEKLEKDIDNHIE